MVTQRNLMILLLALAGGSVDAVVLLDHFFFRGGIRCPDRRFFRSRINLLERKPIGSGGNVSKGADVAHHANTKRR